MNSDYLQKYYHYERHHWWFSIREKIIRQLLDTSLPTGRRLNILNAGAATGRSSQMLMQYGEVISLEKDHDTCVFLRENLKINVVEGDLELLPFENESFDVICIFDVIEHVAQQELAVSELYRVCKTGGVIYCSVPAFSFLWSDHDEINHHKRRYTRKTITSVLEKKFTLEYSTYFNMFLFLPIWFSRVVLQRLKRPQKAVSDFESSRLLNSPFFFGIFRSIFSVELLLLRYFTLPVGVSILLRAKK